MTLAAGLNLDLTQICVSLITTVPAILAARWARNVVKQVKTPSGDTLGEVAERTHDLAAVNTAKLSQVHAAVLNGGHEPDAGPEPEPSGA